MLRIQSMKLVSSVGQMQSASFSSGLSKKQLLRIRSDQKQLYGSIIDDDTTHATENGEQDENENESIVSQPADLKAAKASHTCEFYWLIQRCNKKHVRIFRSKEVEVDVSPSIETK